ncbi:MAG TPA: hypothetical protein DEE98_04105 [Elusimicrobia bacterium]|nr:MAG: hypothetical protein A2278_07115 [Elusimicrobia bacterium RIFOXYA12_FULL_49_49]OGS16193.1 MAG: hypothetical protein A2251_01070 [Elusimicrobia bacterium RIFOXYA2_FULL_47_53]OGS26608.1 MAG: hypothetical protein A2339_04290 [Elusimicrobia bacterium RIFOXYB12_FULL_50_12]OGS31347.1 MAG: hypothetical protein A2323_09360 [Elusimicrobia bacterium RIFOXYB2_FULL_46_23]HBU69550.1 hypothetical protein [Elusimicrobiota bacterium]
MFKYTVSAILALLLSAVVCATDIYLSLSAHGSRMEMGAAGFVPQTPTIEESKASREILEVLLSDLLFSRYFNIVEDGPLYTGKDEELKIWAERGANILICGRIRISKGELILTVQALDIGSKQPIWEKVFNGKQQDIRKIAHEANDDIIQRFTGERGIASSQIVFCNNKTGFKEIYICDYDGYNVRQLTFDRSINILPIWSGTSILFTGYRNDNPDLYSISDSGGKRRVISERQGLNTAAAPSFDGSRIALTLSMGGMPKIYLIAPSGEMIKRLTFGSYSDTSPSFAPNGKEIVYTSDSPGYPQLFIMNVDGGNIRRLPPRGYCDSPAWSPRGDKIVFTMRQGRGDKYDLFVYDLPSGEITRLTQNEGDNENPSWSADGRFIVYSSSRAGGSGLYIIGADGSGRRALEKMAGRSYMPDWQK